MIGSLRTAVLSRNPLVTTIVFPDLDGYLYGDGNTVPDASDGVLSKTAVSTGDEYNAGNRWTGAVYRAFSGFSRFPWQAAIPAGHHLRSLKLYMKPIDISGPNHYSFRPLTGFAFSSIVAANWRTRAQLAALTALSPDLPTALFAIGTYTAIPLLAAAVAAWGPDLHLIWTTDTVANGTIFADGEQYADFHCSRAAGGSKPYLEVVSSL